MSWAEDCDASFTPETDLADGTYSFIVRVADRAGNFVDLEKTVTVDTTAPVIGDIFWDAELKRLKYDAEDGALACSFDGQPDFACGTTVLATDLPDGLHTLTVRLTDAAGNVATKTKSFRIGAETQPGSDGDGDGSDGDGSTGGGTPTGSASNGTGTQAGGAPQSRAPAAPAGAPSGPAAGGPTGSTSPLPTATPAAKKAAAKKRCTTAKKKVRGKTRKVRVCKKAKKNKRAAARRRA
jgi:hypothetical protein